MPPPGNAPISTRPPPMPLSCADALTAANSTTASAVNSLRAILVSFPIRVRTDESEHRRYQRKSAARVDVNDSTGRRCEGFRSAMRAIQRCGSVGQQSVERERWIFVHEEKQIRLD